MMTEEVKIAVRKLESLMKAQILVAAVVLLNPMASAAQKPPVPAPVPVAVIVQSAQFEDQAQKDRLDSAKDLKALLSRKKTLRLVEKPEEAVVIIDILGRFEQAQDKKESADKDKVVRVKLSVGEYSTEIEGRMGANVGWGATWAGAAVEASTQIDKWIKTNRAKLP